MGKSGQAFCLMAGAVLLAGAVAPFFKLTASSMWFDELNLLWHVDPEEPLSLLLPGRISRDFHPPLYFLLQHFWLQLFDNLPIGARLLNSLLGLGVLLLAFLWAWRRLSPTSALFLAAFVSLSYGYVVYSGEGRSYMLAFLLGVPHFAMLWSVTGRENAPATGRPLPPRFWLWFGALSLGLSLTHYYGFLLAGGGYLLLLLVRRNRPDWIWALASGSLIFTILAAYLAWSIPRGHLEAGDTWYANHWRGFVASLWLVVWRGLGGNLFLPPLIAGLGALLLLLRLREAGGEERLRKDLRAAAPLVFLFLFLAAMGIAISLLVAPSFSERNLQVLWPAFWMTSAILFDRAEEALESCRSETIPVTFAARLLASPTSREMAPFLYRVYLEQPELYGIAAFPNDLLAGAAPLPADLTALLSDPGRRCPIALWSVHALARPEIEAVAAKLTAALPGKEILIQEFANESLWPWTGTFLWAKAPPAHSKAYLLLFSGMADQRN